MPTLALVPTRSPEEMNKQGEAVKRTQVTILLGILKAQRPLADFLQPHCGLAGLLKAGIEESTPILVWHSLCGRQMSMQTLQPAHPHPST